MAGAEGAGRLALIIRSGPASSRESRAEVDVALAALSLDMELEVYFTGDAVLQLADQKSTTSALLPGGYKAWAAAQELGEVQIFAESGWLGRVQRLGLELILPVQGLGFAQMKQRWRRCGQVVVL